MPDSTTEWISRQNTPTVVSGIATMNQNATKTLAIPSGGRSVIRIGVPTIDSSTLTFEVQPFPTNEDATGTFRTLKDDAGNTVTVTASTGGFVVDIPELAGAYAFKIVTAAQTSGAVLFEVQCVGQHPSPSGSNKLTIEGGSITANQGTQGSAASPWYVQPEGTNSAVLFPNAAAAADNIALPTVTEIGSVLQAYDGTNIDLLRTSGVSNTSNGSVGILGVNPMLTDGSNFFPQTSSANIGDGTTGASGGKQFGSTQQMTFNETSLDRVRNNTKATLAASAARTSTLTVADQTNYNGAMLHVVIVVTVMASGGLTPVINGKGNLGTYYPLLTGAKITGTTAGTVLKIGPGFATSVNAAAADMLPRTWNMVVTPDDATSITYSIEANVNE